jgi:hypothetical protein
LPTIGLPDLAQGLEEENEADLIFASHISCGFQNTHGAKAGSFIEQEETAFGHLALSVIGTFKTGSDNETGKAWVIFQC